MSKAERVQYDDELRTLIGHNAEAYDHLMLSMAEINQMEPMDARRARAKRLNFERSAWLGLLLPISYFWYRKLWLDGLLITAGWFAIAGLINSLIIETPTLFFHVILGLFTALFGKEYVMERYRGILAQARSRIEDPAERRAYLSQRGGVSKLGGVLPYIVLGVVMLVIFLIYQAPLG
ncbi:MAG: hypothetical protein KI792_01125 [Alphaproteobacteria bacterium]|nr:hypothetical protein [Alphaproteobacteria bacterium SS10]